MFMESLFKCPVKRELLWFLLLFFYSTPFMFVQGVVTQMPSHACVGEDITIDCDLSVPDPNNNFRTNFINFIVGSSDASITDTSINSGTGDHGGVDLTRLTALTNNSFSGDKNVRGSITLSSYTASDAGLRLGCSAIYYLSGNTGTTDVVSETTLLTPAAPPSPSISLQSSVSKFNTASCSANISLSWNTPPSNISINRYFLYLDGSPLVTTNSNSYNHFTILNINTDYQYSVTAMNCAGNSTNSSTNVNSVKSHSLLRSSQTVCLAYDNGTRALTVNWELSTPTQPSGVSVLDITYSLQLLYSHSRQGVTYRYTNSTNFTLPSSQLSYNTVLTAHNFTQLDGVEINITANLMIVQQCGQSFSGTVMECFYNSKNPPISSMSTSYTILYTTSKTNTSSNDTFTTTTPTTSSIRVTTTTFIPTNITEPPSNLLIIIGCAVGAVILLFILITFIILLLILIFFLRKSKANPKQTGTNETDPKEYQELEDTYSEVKKKPKHKPESVKKDESELTYLEIDHSSGTGKIVKPPIIPKTNYADITDFPQETHYASMQTQETQYASMQN